MTFPMVRVDGMIHLRNLAGPVPATTEAEVNAEGDPVLKAAAPPSAFLGGAGLETVEVVAGSGQPASCRSCCEPGQRWRTSREAAGGEGP